MLLDDYANSMFRFERINPGWVARCAAYLRHVFGPAIHGATVIDYAFGRGNWSLAFLEAGAAKVVAIDASASNVARFSEYVADHSIAGVEILEGNVLTGPVAARADILWVYGILHHIDNEQNFVRAMTRLWTPGGNGTGLLYAYNAGSLRQAVVDLARRGVVYDSNQAFISDSALFTHHGRL